MSKAAALLCQMYEAAQGKYFMGVEFGVQVEADSPLEAALEYAVQMRGLWRIHARLESLGYLTRRREVYVEGGSRRLYTFTEKGFKAAKWLLENGEKYEVNYDHE
jgi:hypothetical protein